MRYIKVDNKEEIIKELDKIIKYHKSNRVRDRAKAIEINLKSSMKVPEIARIFGVKTRIVYEWFDRFEIGGIKGLEDRGSRGRKPKIEDKKN